MDKLVKLAVSLGALLAGGGVFFHYAVYLPRIEQQNREAAEQRESEAAKIAQRKELEAIRDEALRRKAYGACKSDARKNYEANWAAACATYATLKSQRLRDCLANKTITDNTYMGERYCKSTFGDSDPSPNCALPRERAEAQNKALHDEEERCIAEAKLGL